MSDYTTWRSLVDGEEISLIPDSVVHQWNTQELSGYSDGDTVTTFDDRVGSVDGSGQATYRDSSINDNPALEFDGIDDKFDLDGINEGHPYTVIIVMEKEDDSTFQFPWGGDPRSSSLQFRDSPDVWQILTDEDNIEGTEDHTIEMATLVIDGPNSALREDGSETATGDAGDQQLQDAAMGYWRENDDRYFEGYIGFVEIHDGTPSDGLETREQEVADMWDISLD